MQIVLRKATDDKRFSPLIISNYQYVDCQPSWNLYFDIA